MDKEEISEKILSFLDNPQGATRIIGLRSYSAPACRKRGTIPKRIRICDFLMDLRRQQAGRPASETAGTAVLLFTNLDARGYSDQLPHALPLGEPPAAQRTLSLSGVDH